MHVFALFLDGRGHTEENICGSVLYNDGKRTPDNLFQDFFQFATFDSLRNDTREISMQLGENMRAVSFWCIALVAAKPFSHHHERDSVGSIVCPLF